MGDDPPQRRRRARALDFLTGISMGPPRASHGDHIRGPTSTATRATARRGSAGGPVGMPRPAMTRTTTIDPARPQSRPFGTAVPTDEKRGQAQHFLSNILMRAAAPRVTSTATGTVAKAPRVPHPTHRTPKESSGAAGGTGSAATAGKPLVVRLGRHGSTTTKPASLLRHTSSTRGRERGLMDRRVLNHRVFLVPHMHGAPTACVSLLRYDAAKERKRRSKQLMYIERSPNISTWLPARVRGQRTDAGKGASKHGVSYAFLLARRAADASDSDEDEAAGPRVYDPHFLDDPRMTTGRHCTVLRLNSWTTSVIPFVKPAALKRELNEQFSARHPELGKVLTLSKIRNLKKDLLDIAIEEDLELSTVALAFVYLEKLILQRLVNKQNRKLIGVVCLLLAVKYNEPNTQHTIADLMDAVESAFSYTIKHVRKLEFRVFSHLGFALHVPPQHVYPHMKRVLGMMDLMLEEYLGHALYSRYFDRDGRHTPGTAPPTEPSTPTPSTPIGALSPRGYESEGDATTPTGGAIGSAGKFAFTTFGA